MYNTFKEKWRKYRLEFINTDWVQIEVEFLYTYSNSSETIEINNILLTGIRNAVSAVSYFKTV